MGMTNTMSISEARAKIFDVTDKVEKTGQSIVLTQNGQAKVVMMSVDEFESWEETVAIRSEVPGLLKDIAKVKKDIQSGAYRKYPTIEEIIIQANDSKKQKVSRKSRA